MTDTELSPRKLLYAIGDVHGCYDELIELLGLIEVDRAGAPAKVVFVGDYTDRGPKSFEVVEHIWSMKDKFTSGKSDLEVVTIRGNHDEMLLNTIDCREMYNFIGNGGGTTLTSYSDNGRDLEYHRTFFEGLEWMHRDGDFLFVHANIDPSVALNEQHHHTLIWERDYNNYDKDYPENVFVVHGHTPVTAPYRRKNQLNIDTGCVFGRWYSEEYGWLTAVRLDSRDSMKFLKVKFKGKLEDE